MSTKAKAATVVLTKLSTSPNDMTTTELLEKIKVLEQQDCPDKEDWFDLLYNNKDTIVAALEVASRKAK